MSMSTITTEHVRRLWAGLCLISFLAIAGSVTVLLVLSYRWAEDEMIKALDHQSVVVGHSIRRPLERAIGLGIPLTERSEEHTSELQSLMRISYAVFCLKKKNNTHRIKHNKLIPHK